MFSLCIVETERWKLLNDSCKLLTVSVANFNTLPDHKVNSGNVVFSLSWSQGTLLMLWIGSENCTGSSILLNSENIFHCVSRKLFSSATWEQQLKYSRTLPLQVVLFQILSVMVSAVKAVTKVKALFLPLVWKSDKDRVCSCPLVSCHVPQLEEGTLIFK